jgi:hypothetical protein
MPGAQPTLDGTRAYGSSVCTAKSTSVADQSSRRPSQMKRTIVSDVTALARLATRTQIRRRRR